jgi:hypothetical protein
MTSTQNYQYCHKERENAKEYVTETVNVSFRFMSYGY